MQNRVLSWNHSSRVEYGIISVLVLSPKRGLLNNHVTFSILEIKVEQMKRTDVEVMTLRFLNALPKKIKIRSFIECKAPYNSLNEDTVMFLCTLNEECKREYSTFFFVNCFSPHCTFKCGVLKIESSIDFHLTWCVRM